MKKIISIILTLTIISSLFACSTKSVSNDMQDQHQYDDGLSLDGIDLSSYDADVVLCKRRCIKNGYQYETNDFSHTYEYDDLPTLKIEKCFDYDPKRGEEYVSKLKSAYEETLYLVPEQVRKLMYDSGVTVHFVLEAKEYWNSLQKDPGGIAGMYAPSTNNIYISTGTYMRISSMKSKTLYHELGHTIDHYLGNLASTKEFKSAYKEEHEFFVKTDRDYRPDTDNKEAFAYLFELFMITYAVPAYNNVIRTHTMQNEAPKLYTFMVEKLSLIEDW